MMGVTKKVCSLCSNFQFSLHGISICMRNNYFCDTLFYSGNSLRIISKSSIPHSTRAGSSVIDEALDLASYVTFAEVEEATRSFSKRIGEGSFGSVYYGKMKDGKEVAVKISAYSSIDGTRQFTNEVFYYHLLFVSSMNFTLL